MGAPTTPQGGGRGGGCHCYLCFSESQNKEKKVWLVAYAFNLSAWVTGVQISEFKANLVYLASSGPRAT